jgi:hypothetical protein
MVNKRKYSRPGDLQKKVDEYFEVTPITEVTIAGLALHCGLTRQGLSLYEKRKEFKDVVEMAKERVAHIYELRLVKSGNTAMIFALKNMGWYDKQDINQQISMSDPLTIVRKTKKKKVDGGDRTN